MQQRRNILWRPKSNFYGSVEISKEKNAISIRYVTNTEVNNGDWGHKIVLLFE